MNDRSLGGVVRALRHRRRMRQADLAARAGVSGSLVSLLERGHVERLSLRGLRRIVGALDLRLEWDAGFRGSELARLRDADHARVSEWLARRLETLNWRVNVEVSFNRFGDRGRIDLLAFHPVQRVLVVVEVKTVIADIQELLGTLHMKVRVAGHVARSLGWTPVAIVPMLVVADGTTNRRRVAAHDRLFARFVLRGPAARRWLSHPVGSVDGVLLFAKVSDSNPVGARQAGRQRVRNTGPRMSSKMADARLDSAPRLG
jgi:transcriptional regulator with XRE-family HTH domain